MNTSIFRSALKISALPLICLLAVFSLLSIIPQQAISADAPGIPNQFFGALTINGAAAAAGYTVTAKVNGVDSGSTTTTDSQGRYGYSPVFMIPGSQGGSITFYVNGAQAAPTATLQPGAITSLALTVSGTVPASGTTTQTTTTATTTTTPATTETTTTTPTTTETTPAYTSSTSSTSTSTPSTETSTTPAPAMSQTSAPAGTPSFADYSFSELTVAPQVANTGDQITATVRVVNSGNGSDSKNVVLKVNDVNMAQQVVQLDPGKSQYIDFTFTENTPGTYSVIVEGQTATLQVQAAPAQAPAGGSSSIPVMVIIAAGVLLVIVLVVLLVMRRRQD